jgi:hypothetical protein
MPPSGVDVMIKIYCDFRQFLANEIGASLKNPRYDPNFAKKWQFCVQKTAIL